MKNSLIYIFLKHKVAPNLLMAIMILTGIWALSNINVQFFPNFQIPFITVNSVWPGANAKDVERSVTNPIELQLKNLENVKRISSSSSQNLSSINVEFDYGTDMLEAISKVRDEVGMISNLPDNLEKPIIKKQDSFEIVASLILYGPENLETLKYLAYKYKKELLAKGINKINVRGIPKKEINIEFPSVTLYQLQKSIPDIASNIKSINSDISAGLVGQDYISQPLRSENKKTTIQELQELNILSNQSIEPIKLGSIANIYSTPKDDDVLLFYENSPAIELVLMRQENENALKSANKLYDWLQENKQQSDPGIKIKVYNEYWQLIKERIQVLLKNGLGGLILILIALFIFLDRRVAVWISAGIPISFLAAITILYLSGGSINMISLFALIMSLGIIVDDTIVVGEEALTNTTESNLPLATAIYNGAYKMVAPISAASLTTIAAFIPLLVVGNIIGAIIKVIPFVIIFVIIASLLECFLVLPGHLYHSLKNPIIHKKNTLSTSIKTKFDYFTNHTFKKMLIVSLNYKISTIILSLCLFVISIILVTTGRIPFNFFPSPEGRILSAEIQFISGTSEDKKQYFIDELLKTLKITNKKLSKNDEPFVETILVSRNTTSILDRNSIKKGSNYTSIQLETRAPELRELLNKEFIDEWEQKIKIPEYVENFYIYVPESGPPGKDLDIVITSKNDNISDLQGSVTEIKNIIKNFTGLYNIKSDLGSLHKEIVFDLTNEAKSIGLNTSYVGNQLRAALNGSIINTFYTKDESIDIKVLLSKKERDNTAVLQNLPIFISPNNASPLSSIITLDSEVLPDTYTHLNNQLTTHVTSSINNKLNSADAIIKKLNKDVLPTLSKKYNVNFSFVGKAEEQSETFSDMLKGLILGVALVYIILAWVFKSYGWPIIVLTTVPLGLTGAIFGHMLMGIDLTILSIFGLFGLSGIVINDSIILINEYNSIKNGKSLQSAIVQATIRRLRPIFLTSLTTVVGLIPLLMESSLQAQFLIPMATAIAAGLAYSAILILFFIPSVLFIYESRKNNKVLRTHN